MLLYPYTTTRRGGSKPQSGVSLMPDSVSACALPRHTCMAREKSFGKRRGSQAGARVRERHDLYNAQHLASRRHPPYCGTPGVQYCTGIQGTIQLYRRQSQSSTLDAPRGSGPDPVAAHSPDGRRTPTACTPPPGQQHIHQHKLIHTKTTRAQLNAHSDFPFHVPLRLCAVCRFQATASASPPLSSHAVL